jgi:osmotically-inducible protein OsmY
MKKALIPLALAACSVLSADNYQDGYGRNEQGSCPSCQNGGNSQYQSRPYRSNPQDEQYYQNRPYGSNQQGNYNEQNSNGYRGQGYNDRGNQGQGYYNGRDNQGYDNNQRYYNERRNNRNSGYQDQNYSNDQENRDNRRYDDRGQNNQDRKDRPITDQEITKKIQDAIGPGVFSNGYSDVKFSINNGSVILKGSVDNLDDKNKVEESVKKIDGVKQVENQIRVAGKQTAYIPLTGENLNKIKEYETKFPNDKAQTEGDRLINARIQEKLNGGWFSRGYPNIALSTSEGNVTVTGYVDSPDDIKKIDEEIKKFEDVKSVINEVSVKK